MKILKYIFLIFTFLGLFQTRLEAKTVILENDKIEVFVEQDFTEISAETKWLNLLYLQESTSQYQTSLFQFSFKSLTQNFSGELCSKIYANDSQSGFLSIKKSRSYQGNDGWNEIVFNENLDLVDAWKKLDDLRDNAFDQLRKDPDFLKQFDEVSSNGKLNKHTFEGDIKVKTNPDGTLKYEIGGVHSNKVFSDGKIRIKSGTEIEDLGDGFYKAKVEKQIDGLVNDQGTNWKVKKNKSTFFPDSWNTEKIQAEIAHAFKNKTLEKGNKYSGFTTGGKKITMYLDDAGKIKTAFPDL